MKFKKIITTTTILSIMNSASLANGLIVKNSCGAASGVTRLCKFEVNGKTIFCPTFSGSSYCPSKEDCHNNMLKNKREKGIQRIYLSGDQTIKTMDSIISTMNTPDGVSLDSLNRIEAAVGTEALVKFKREMRSGSKESLKAKRILNHYEKTFKKLEQGQEISKKESADVIKLLKAAQKEIPKNTVIHSEITEILKLNPKEQRKRLIKMNGTDNHMYWAYLAAALVWVLIKVAKGREAPKGLPIYQDFKKNEQRFDFQ